MSDGRHLKVAVIGVGNIGGAHARAIYSGEVSGMKLAALCDCDQAVMEKLREKYPDIPLFSDHVSLLNSGLCDAVIISTPHYFHPPIAIDAFKAGLHVLSEKPAGVDTNSARAMTDAAKQSGKVFGIMFNQRANKLFSAAKDIMLRGELGELKRVVWIITNWYRKQAYYDSGNWRATWSGEGGGVLINQAPHNLDLWQWLCGMPSAIRAECYEAKHHSIEVEDDATIFAEYENGATAVFITSTGDYPGTNRLEITGTKGKLVLEGGKLMHYRLAIDEREFCLMDAKAKNEVTVSELDDEKRNCHVAILENFADHILNGAPLIAPGEEAVNELELSNGAYLSAWEGKKISLPLNGEDFLKRLEEKKATSHFLAKATKEDMDDKVYSERWSTKW